MSRRIISRTEMTDKDLVLSAARAASIEAEVLNNDLIQFTSGPMADSTLNLKTGVVQGDSDFGHTTEGLGLLRQHYTEAKIRRECQKDGTSISQRHIDEEGNIILMAHRA
jgi:hypothetical protein